MLLDERRQYILDQLRRDGRVIAKDISEELNLSEDTIRRDLRELAAEGLLQRVHDDPYTASDNFYKYHFADYAVLVEYQH